MKLRNLCRIMISVICVVFMLFCQTVFIVSAENNIELLSIDDLFDGGKGTIEDPYIITTAEQLLKVNIYNDKAYKIDGYIYWDSVKKEIEKLYGEDNIPNYVIYNFNGVLDGSDAVLMYFERPLFNINNGLIKDLELIGPEIAGAEQSAPLCLKNNGEIIQCCVTTILVSDLYDTAGFVYENTKTGRINRCYVASQYNYVQDSHIGFVAINNGIIEESYSAYNTTSNSSEYLHFPFTSEEYGIGKFLRCYCDKGDLIGTTEHTKVNGITCKSIKEMTLKETYIDWDLDYTWKIGGLFETPTIRYEKEVSISIGGHEEINNGVHEISYQVYSTTDIPVDVIAAFYKDGRLIDVDIHKNVSTAPTARFSKIINVGGNLSWTPYGNYSLKIMAWDIYGNMQPLGKVKEETYSVY